MTIPHITGVRIAYQPWEGTPSNPKFKSPIYSVKYETLNGSGELQFPAQDAISARQIASRKLNIPFSMAG
jgi:hypothetical protein